MLLFTYTTKFCTKFVLLNLQSATQKHAINNLKIIFLSRHYHTFIEDITTLHTDQCMYILYIQTSYRLYYKTYSHIKIQMLEFIFCKNVITVCGSYSNLEYN